MAGKERTMATKEKESVNRSHAKMEEKYASQIDAVMKATGGDPSKITPELSKKLGLAPGRIQMRIVQGSLKPSDKLYLQDLSEEELGKKLVDLRDRKGLKWRFDIWARTLMTEEKARTAYEKAGGKDWGVAHRAATKNGAAKKTAAKKTAAPRARRTAKKTAARSGGGSRSKRAGLLNEVHASETSEERLAEILEGRSVTVEVELTEGNVNTNVYHVATLRKFSASEGNGRVMEFYDEDHKMRAVALSSVVGVR